MISACKSPKCDQKALIKNIYHTIPEKIHQEYLENVEVKSFEKRHRHNQQIFLNTSGEELIAFPRKNEFPQDSEVISNAIDEQNSKTLPNIKFEPIELDFGMQ